MSLSPSTEECITVGCVPGPLQWPPRDVSTRGAVLAYWGVSAYFVSVQLSNLLVYNYQTNATAGQKPRSPCEQTDASENITFPCIR